MAPSLSPLSSSTRQIRQSPGGSRCQTPCDYDHADNSKTIMPHGVVPLCFEIDVQTLLVEQCLLLDLN